MHVETSSSLHRCRNPLPKLSLLPTTVVWIKNAQISVSFTSTATASGSNMCALKPHHHCTVAKTLSPKLSLLPTTVVWIKNAQISVSFTSTATASGSKHVCVETSSSLHRCRKPPPTLWLLTQLWSGSRILTYRFRSRQRRPPLDLTCVR